MSNPLEFSFDQNEMQALIDQTSAKKIAVYLCNFPESDGTSELYLCAQALDADKNPVSFNLIVACPKPPGWTKVFVTAAIRQSLGSLPAFVIDSVLLNEKLPLNTYKENGIPKVYAAMEGRIVNKENRQDGKQVPSLESFVSFKIEKLDGSSNTVIESLDTIAL